MTDTVPPDLIRKPNFTRDERRGFARRGLAGPVALLAGLVVLYLALLVVTLAAPPILAIVPAVICGISIGMLFIAGHDCCHNSFTRSARVNRILGRIAFLAPLHAFPLWDLDHNRTHHRYNNIRGLDYAWVPMTVDEYRQSSSLRRAMYRLYRSPAGVALYYMLALWAPRFVLARPAAARANPGAYLPDTILIWAFLAAQIWVVIAIGGLFGKGAFISLLFGLLIPFVVWNAVMSFAIFMHHTHPAIRWYTSIPEWEADQGAIHGTAHVKFPRFVEIPLLSIMEHNAHHYASGVPLYNSPRMQRRMAETTDFISWRFSLKAYARICQRCKLYDYEAAKWLTFDAADKPSG